MHSDQSTNGPPPPPADLLPVEPPSAGFILQLFLVPGILVTILMAFIIFFFGGPGGGPQTADDFIDALRSPNDKYRWKTAEHLAQVLQRDDGLARDVKLALAITELLDRELKNPPPPVSDDDPNREEAPDSARFLAAAAGRFQVPAAMPVLQRMIDQNEPIEDVGRRLRLRAGLWAVALLGESLHEYDQLPDETKGSIVTALADEAGSASPDSARPAWAKAAFDHLSYRHKRGADPSVAGKEPFGVIDSLAKGARSEDEMCRKYTILALSQWNEPGAERLLQELAGGNADLRYFEDDRPERGRREIRYNAALALARRASPHTPLELVLETLNEERQRALNPDNPGMADQTLLIGLRAVQELKRHDRAAFERETALVAAVESLARSANPRLQVEARKVLGGGTRLASTASAGPSRQAWLMLLVGGGVVILLALAVFARWRRNTAAGGMEQPMNADKIKERIVRKELHMAATKEQVIGALRKAYSMEVETVVNYLANSLHLEGVRAEAIKQALATDIQEELGHAQQLGNRIKQLGGVVPGSLQIEFNEKALQPPADSTDVVGVIRGVLEAEEAAIKHYKSIIKLTDGDDYVTQDLAITLLGQEEAHRQQFEGYLKEYSKT